MNALNLYLCGVGGQGIALLNEVVTRAAVAAAYSVKGVETHGLAQRGGVVRAHLRIGAGVRTPIIPPGQADLVLALERLEALRGAMTMLRPGGTLIYFDTTQDPTVVRQRQSSYPTAEAVAAALEERGAKVLQVSAAVPDEKMQNVALIARLAQSGLIPKLDVALVRQTLTTVLPAHALEANLTLFDAVAGSAAA